MHEPLASLNQINMVLVAVLVYWRLVGKEAVELFKWLPLSCRDLRSGSCNMEHRPGLVKVLTNSSWYGPEDGWLLSFIWFGSHDDRDTIPYLPVMWCG